MISMRVRSSKQLRPCGANSRTLTIWMTGCRRQRDPTTRLTSAGSADPEPRSRLLRPDGALSSRLCAPTRRSPAACTYVLDREVRVGSVAPRIMIRGERPTSTSVHRISWCVGKTHGDKSCKLDVFQGLQAIYLNKTWTLRSDITLTFALRARRRGDGERDLARAAAEARDSSKQWLVVEERSPTWTVWKLVVIWPGLDQVIDRGAGVLGDAVPRFHRAMTRAAARVLLL